MSSLLATIVHSAGSILTTYLFETSSWFSSCCFCCFDFHYLCFHLVPKTLTAQWNQPPWCWSVLRVHIVPIRERAAGVTVLVKLNVAYLAILW